VFELGVKTHFSAAHHLKNYRGKCADLHGHNWAVEVFISGRKLNKIGILVDFRMIKTMIGDVLLALDHADLNRLAAFRSANPTSENIARHICEKLSVKLRKTGCKVSRVVVGETPDTTATYSPGK